MKRQSRGFTFFEIMVVVAILTVVSAIVWMAIAGRVRISAKQARLKADFKQVLTAVNLYINDNDQGLPNAWKNFGYYGVNKKDKFGKGYPPQDVKYDRPPEYDVSYHTPTCAQPPKAPLSFYLFRQFVSRFKDKPRANELDVDSSVALQFPPACIPNSLTTRTLRVLRDGSVRKYQMPSRNSMSADLSMTIFFQHEPDWLHEINLGN